jgi:class 3 adenylate cyclase
VDVPDVSYARSGDVAIAYQVVGEGPKDLVLLPFLSNLYTVWQSPGFATLLRRLAQGRRLIVVNLRGVGLSDRPRGFTIESRMDDLRAVLDAVESERPAVEAFLEGTLPRQIPDTVLATLLFTDLVDSTKRAVELGDRAWGSLLEEHNRVVRVELERFRGVELDTAGDGFFASFDGPARAIACASAIVERVPELGLHVRAGIHTGECERVGQKLAGLAVNVGARIVSVAGQGEVLVSSTVKDLVAGAGIEFEDRGAHELKGVPGEWRLYAVSS